jgi:molybdate transport system ATP-binding protein
VNTTIIDREIRVNIRQRGPIPLAIAFACAPGEFLAIVGPSGAGKSTALRSIAGLYEPAEGTISCGSDVWFDASKRITMTAQQRRVGLVFQSYALFPHLNALHNVAAAMSHHPKSERLDRARRLLTTVHLDGFQDRRPAELSGGQQQRIALARALARDPNVLLLDEPLSAVDRRTRRRLRAELLEVRTSLSAPVILVTHDLDDASTLADRMLVLDRGEIIQEGAPRDVMTNPASDRVREALDLNP